MENDTEKEKWVKLKLQVQEVKEVEGRQTRDKKKSFF